MFGDEESETNAAVRSSSQSDEAATFRPLGTVAPVIMTGERDKTDTVATGVSVATTGANVDDDALIVVNFVPAGRLGISS
eukprot:COSAG05_NODE_3884_length_1791_cov_1.150709_3_plen_79_part_01